MTVRIRNAKLFGFAAAVLLIACMFVFMGINGAFAGSAEITAPDNVILYPCNDDSEMSVTWWDVKNLSSAQVVYGTDSNLQNATTKTATLVEAADSYSAFEAKLTGLTAGTKYYYKVGHDSTWSQIYSFTTEAANVEKFNFLYLGDVQYTNKTNAQNEYNEWASLLTKAVETTNPAFALLGGDMVQTQSLIDDWNMFLGAATGGFSSVPMLAVTGNHETNGSTGIPENMLKYLALPENGPEGFAERFYSYDYGSCHITVLDSNVFSGEQKLTEADLAAVKQWIVDDLKNSDAKWKIVAMHHPAYTVVADDISTQVMDNWVEVFEEAQADLVLCGHQHIYMRTYPMYSGKKNPNGITYVMGNSGSKFYAKADVFYSASMIENTSTYQQIIIDGDKLVLNTCNKDGQVLDTVSLNARDRSVPIADIEVIAGDIDGDGVVNSLDYNTLINAILNCTTTIFMDVNSDGKVNIADAHYVKNVINAAAGN